MQYRFLRFPGFKSKALTLSYDDGMRSDARLIEILDRYGLKCTFNLNSGLFAQNEGEGRRLTLEQAVALYSDSPHEVAVHGAKHLSLASIDDDGVMREILFDRGNLERIFGRFVVGMAYANGSCDDRVAALVKNCGICYARTVVSTGKFDLPENWLLLPATCHHADARLFALVDEFLAPEPPSPIWSTRPQLFYLWGHSYEFDDHNNWEVIEQFAAKMGGRDDIYYATNGEIYRYVKAYEALEVSSDDRLILNPTAIDVYLDCFGKKVCVRSGQTVNLKKIEI